MPANVEYAKYIFDCVTAACGGCCCICRRSDVKLVRGHLTLGKNGGPATMPNIMPICSSCNGKFRDSTTPDERPDGWFGRFILRLISDYKASGYPVTKIFEQVNLLATTQSIDSIGITNSPESTATKKSNYNTCTLTPTHSPGEIVQEIFEHSADWGANDGEPPPRPFSMKERGELEQRVRDSSVDDFRLAAKEFQLKKAWLTGDERHPYASNNSWAEMVMPHSYKRLVKLGRERAAREAAAKEFERIETRRIAWGDYLRVADVPKWPGMPADDEALIDAAIADKVAEPSDVDMKTRERCREVWDNYHRHKYGVLEAFRRELFTENDTREFRSRLAQLWRKSKDLNVYNSEFGHRVALLRDRIRAGSIEQLHECAKVIDAMNVELDSAAANLASAAASAKPSSPKRKRRRRL